MVMVDTRWCGGGGGVGEWRRGEEYTGDVRCSAVQQTTLTVQHSAVQITTEMCRSARLNHDPSQASIDSLSGDTKESGEKNEAKQEKTEDESDESLGAAPVTISTEKTAAQLEDEKESEKDTNNEKKVIKGMHMKEKDETGPEIDGLKDKYAGNAFSLKHSLLIAPQNLSRTTVVLWKSCEPPWSSRPTCLAGSSDISSTNQPRW